MNAPISRGLLPSSCICKYSPGSKNVEMNAPISRGLLRNAHNHTEIPNIFSG